MPYDENLTFRIREVFAARDAPTGLFDRPREQTPGANSGNDQHNARQRKHG